MKYLFLIILLSNLLNAQDPKHLKLEKKLQAANTQTDMNTYSYELAQYLNRKLLKLETQLKKKLDEAGLKLFVQSSQSWYKYRLMQARFTGHLYKGGSMHPLIYNTTLASMTERRILQLEQILEEYNR